MKFKIFFGCNDPYKKENSVVADELANEWIEKNPNVIVLDYKYQHTRYGNHSICIAYYEAEQNDET